MTCPDDPKGLLQCKAETRLLHLGEKHSDYFGAVVPPIVQTSLFVYESYEDLDNAFAERDTHFIYTRGQNPTVDLTASKVADMEGAEAGKLFSSGMAAISSTVLSQVKAGDHIVCVKSAYGPTRTFLADWLPRFGVNTTFVDGKDLGEFEAAVRPTTRLFYLESPTSVILELQDLRAIASIAKKHGIVTAADNSWATPVFQNPIGMGIDLVLHSASKYLGGHSDIVAGVVVGRKHMISSIGNAEQTLLGAILGPFDAWLLLRGLRTLDVRMRRHERNAAKVAQFLDAHPKVERVNYPGLASYPQRELAGSQMSGSSGLMSVLIDSDLPGVKRFVNSLKLFGLGVSWGGFESLVYAPIISMAREQPEEAWRAAGIKPGLVRLAIGLEDPDDLIDDLNSALRKA